MTRAERRLKTELEQSAALWILREFIHERGSYEGPASWVLQHLAERATDEQRAAPGFPKNARQLGALLSKHTATLANKGITVSYSRHGKHGRLWLLVSTNSPRCDGTQEEKPNGARRGEPVKKPKSNRIRTGTDEADEILRKIAEAFPEINLRAL